LRPDLKNAMSATAAESPGVLADESQAAPPPQCPRCGYDQSGVVESWHSTCPLAGVCSECGLELEWRLLLNPQLSGPPWSFEQAESALALRCFLTSLRTLLPWRMWRELHLAHRIRSGRLFAFAAVGACVWYGLIHLQAAWAAGWFAPRWWVLPHSFAEWLELIVWPYGAPALDGWAAVLGAMLLVGFLPVLLMGLWMSVLGTTLSLARVRKAHLWRGIIYGIPGGVMLVPLMAALVLAFSTVVSAPADSVVAMTLGPVIALYLCWVGAWWLAFVKHYLRLARSGLIVGVLMIPTVLALAVGLIGLMLVNSPM
jgi:hypothetical protein